MTAYLIVNVRGDFISLLHSLLYTVRILRLKMTEAAPSKQKDLLLSDQIFSNVQNRMQDEVKYFFYYRFPSSTFLGLGQMIVAVIILFLGRSFGHISFPQFDQKIPSQVKSYFVIIFFHLQNNTHLLFANVFFEAINCFNIGSF